jgi:hypothetical protein
MAPDQHCHPERMVRDLRFLPEFTLSFAEGVEMTEPMFSMLRDNLWRE